MKLKDIADMQEYLENRCYCPYEIYDMSGFFFNIFKPDTECELLIGGKRGAVHGSFVIAKPQKGNLQIIYIEHENGYVESCLRLDATEINKKQILGFMNGSIEKMTIHEYSETKTVERVKNEHNNRVAADNQKELTEDS